MLPARRVLDPADTPPGVWGQSRGMGTLSLPCCHKAGRTSVGRLFRSSATTSPQGASSSGRTKAGQRHFAVLLLLRLNSCSSPASHDFFGNNTLRTPVLFGLLSRSLPLGGDVGESKFHEQTYARHFFTLLYIILTVLQDNFSNKCLSCNKRSWLAQETPTDVDVFPGTLLSQHVKKLLLYCNAFF